MELKLQRLRYITVVVDGNFNAPAKKFADYFINTSIYDSGEL